MPGCGILTQTATCNSFTVLLHAFGCLGGLSALAGALVGIPNLHNLDVSQQRKPLIITAYIDNAFLHMSLNKLGLISVCGLL